MTPLEENNFYYYQILGLPVIDEDNNTVGVVEDMHNMGAGDVVIVNLNINRLVYLPFDEYMFPQVHKDKIIISKGGLEYIFEE